MCAGLEIILTDKGLAKLGDAYVNFIYSLALTEIEGKPTGIKVSDRILSNAAKKSGLKDLLAKRTRRDDTANAVEALIVYVWREELMRTEEAIDILKKNPNSCAAFTDLISEAIRRVMTIEKHQGQLKLTNKR
ncbi:ribonuclease III family protein [[Eubacterium] cellulosolvens]